MSDEQRPDSTGATVDALGNTVSSSGPARVHGSQLPDGTNLGGRYHVTRLLGKGGMGAVYLAADLALEQLVALKFVTLDADEGLEPLRNEVRLATRVAHPNVCRTFDLEEMDGHRFVKMEYVNGGTLAQRITEQGRLPVDEALSIARHIVEGLEAAHRQGVVHRDLKPQNILLEAGSDRVVLTDFGLARPVDARASRHMSGTPEYMAPEQARGLEVDGRADLYSLGCVLYAMLTGEVPFPAKTPMEAAQRQVEDPAPDLRQRREDVPVWLRRVIGRLLAKDPGDRFADAGAVRVALAAPTARRWRWPVLAGVAVVALILGAGAAAWRMNRPQPTPWLPAIHAQRPEFDENADTAAISPDGAQQAYPSSRDGTWRLYLAPLLGGAGRPVTTAEMNASYPRFARDGKSLLYVDVRQRQAYRLPLDGGPPVKVADNVLSVDDCGEGRLLFAVKSAPDCAHCDRLVVRDAGGGERELVRYSDGRIPRAARCDRAGRQVTWYADGATWLLPLAGGSPPRRLLDGLSNNPAFTPDGRSVVVQADRDGKTNLWEVAVDGGARRQLTFGEGPDRAPEISPDGKTLLFNIDVTSAPIFAVTGGVERKITPTVDFFKGLVIARDGATAVAHIAVSGNQRGGTVVAIALDSGEQRLLGQGRAPAVSSDGREAIFAEDAGRRVVAVPLRGGARRVLGELPGWALSMVADDAGTLHLSVSTAEGPQAWRLPLAGGVAERDAPAPWTAIIPAPRGGWRMALRARTDAQGNDAIILPPGAPLDDKAAQHLEGHLLTWDADGRSVVYLAHREIHRRFVATGEDRVLSRGGAVFSLSPSPDGNTLYFSRVIGHARRQIMTNFGDRPPLR